MDTLYSEERDLSTWRCRARTKRRWRRCTAPCNTRVLNMSTPIRHVDDEDVPLVWKIKIKKDTATYRNISHVCVQHEHITCVPTCFHFSPSSSLINHLLRVNHFLLSISSFSSILDSSISLPPRQYFFQNR